MRISYYADTDTLYIELNEVLGADTRECAKDMVVDLNANGEPIGIEIEYASRKVDLSRLKTKGLPEMRITYDPINSTRDLLWNAGYGPHQAWGGATFHIDLAGNGESAHLIAEQLSRQTEFDPAEFRR
jgi:uncharacterized protein YuzE